jgi:REP element-mobilizing transposase RayT
VLRPGESKSAELGTLFPGSGCGAVIELPLFMARGPRIDYPGACHHVYARGIEKRDIFHDDQDCKLFLERVGFNLKRWDISCIAWALMPNHFHLLVRSWGGNLSSFMRCLLTGYSMYFNERCDRVGHLFQNRYKSRVISKESHMRVAIRYIHLNPLRGKQVKSMRELDRHPWTGHKQILSGGDAEWQDLSAMMEFFPGPGRSCWVSHYRKFIESGSSMADLATEAGGITASLPFESIVIPEAPGHSRLHEKFLEILSNISMRYGVPTDRIMGKARGFSEVGARRQVLRECKAGMDVSAAQICRWLGISEGAGGYLLRSGSKKPGRTMHGKGNLRNVPVLGTGKENS